jgi:dTDP-4-dehydrorhamnose 3,5-epimerase
MKINQRKLTGVYEIISYPINDERGSFSRLFDEQIANKAGLNTLWYQESISHTIRKNTIRGLHASLPPSLEGKTITAIKGKIQWVVVDIRKKSSTFGEWDSIILSEQNHKTLYAEQGFAHGCLSLSDDCTLLLRADNYYSEVNGTGIFWGDEDIGVEWELDGPPIISDRDRQYGSFSKFKEENGAVIL